MTTKTNLGLVEWVLQWVGQRYWYGTCCYDCTTSLLNRKSHQYPSHYTNSRMAQYKADVATGRKCCDCVGLIKGFYWTKDDGTQVYGLDGRPDKGANGMFNIAKVKGSISTLPEIPGLFPQASSGAPSISVIVTVSTEWPGTRMTTLCFPNSQLHSLALIFRVRQARMGLEGGSFATLIFT